MWQYSENLRALYETPVPSADPADLESGRAKANTLIESVKKAGRTILTEAESKELLGCYGIPTVITKIAKTEAEAAKLAKEIGFPIVLKLYSETITHKTDVGGVQLNLKDEADVRRAFNDIKTACTEKKPAEHFQGVTVQKMIKLGDGYEIILGSSIDPQFGPVLLFGMGGQLVEVFKDKALGPAAAQHHPGPPHDGNHQDLQGAQGRARPQAGGPRRPGKAHGRLQPARRRTALDQGN
jgi:acetyltransferase